MQEQRRISLPDNNKEYSIVAKYVNFNVSSQIGRINALSKDNFTYVGLGETISNQNQFYHQKINSVFKGCVI